MVCLVNCLHEVSIRPQEQPTLPNVVAKLPNAD